MEMKKTWLSHCLWLAFAVTAGILFGAYLSAMGINRQEMNKYMASFLIWLAFALTVLFWFAGNKIAGALDGKLWGDEHSRKMLECFLVMCLFAAAVLYRIQMLKYLDMPEGGVYYDMASIKSAGGVPKLAHGASYCYTLVLSAVLSFSGNKAVAGILLQIVLQALSLLFLYFGIKLLCGRAEALCAMAVMAFLPSYAGQISYLRPEVFYFFLFALGILLAGLCGRANGEGGRKKGTYAVFIFTGVYIGAMGYLDASGFLLFLFVGSRCWKEAMDGENGHKGGDRRIEKCKSGGLKFFLCLLGAFLAMLCLMAGDAVLSGSSLEGVWDTWLRVFVAGGNSDFPAGAENFAVGAFLCFLCLLGGIGFWFHKRQKQDVWIFYFFIVAVWNIVSGGIFGYEILIALGWAVLAGIGIASMGVWGETEETAKAAVPDLVLEDMDAAAMEEEEPEKPKVKFIENPLPLPKKHVRREMDFDRIVEWDKMKFDVVVDEGDDFDI